MLIIPAIDIKKGNCVRLLQGDPNKETVYSSDPVDMAKRFEDMGAQLIHVVDLDGAFSGDTVNMELVIEISKAVSIPIEIGGGIRTIESAGRYIDAGIKRIIFGTLLLEEEFSGFIDKFSDYIIAGVDARDSMVATHGWKSTTKINAIDFIKELKKIGIKETIYTDISTDGMLKGPNFSAYEKILSEVKGISIIASGGISSYEDIKRLSYLCGKGLKGCITGKAIYDGKIDLGEAIKLVNKA